MKKENNTVYEQSRKNPRTGFKETIWTHDKHTPGYKWTGKKHINSIHKEE